MTTSNGIRSERGPAWNALLRTLGLGRARRFVQSRWILLQQILELSRSRMFLMVSFIAVAIVNAATESFSVMLVVPILQTISTSNVFEGVPILSQITAFLQGVPLQSRLRWLALVLCVIAVGRGVLSYLVDILSYTIPSAIERDLRVRSFKTLMDSRIEFFDKLSAGEISNYTASFPARVGIAARFLTMMVSNFAILGLICAMLVSIAPVAVAAIAVFVVVGSIVFRRLTGPLAILVGNELTRVQEHFNQTFYEAINNRRNIRVFGAAPLFESKLSEFVERLKNVQLHAQVVQLATYPFFSTAAGILVCLFVFVLSLMAPERSQTLLGLLVVFLVALARLLGPFSTFHVSRMHFSTHVEAVEGAFTFFNWAQRFKEQDGDLDAQTVEGALEFDQVAFAYNDSGPVLRDLSFKIRPGEMVAIVGPSGAGKSTLMSLITRLYRTSAGQVRIDGVDINRLRAQSWWRQIAYVSQDIPLFNGSIRENLRFGLSREPSNDEIHRAAAQAGATQLFTDLPHGVDTLVSDLGARFSGGERQRIALTRAFLRQTKVILLDEPTSALDALTERTIAASLDALRGECTIVVIAHRLSTVRSADRIIVLSKGMKVEEGEHEELKALNGIYASMLQAQMLR